MVYLCLAFGWFVSALVVVTRYNAAAATEARLKSEVGVSQAKREEMRVPQPQVKNFLSFVITSLNFILQKSVLVKLPKPQEIMREAIGPVGRNKQSQ